MCQWFRHKAEYRTAVIGPSLFFANYSRDLKDMGVIRTVPLATLHTKELSYEEKRLVILSIRFILTFFKNFQQHYFKKIGQKFKIFLLSPCLHNIRQEFDDRVQFTLT